MQRMAYPMQEEKQSGSRAAFEHAAVYGFNNIKAFGSSAALAIPNGVQNAGSALLEGFRSGDVATISETISNVTDFSIEVSKTAKEGATIAALVTFGIETSIHTFRWIKGDISGKQWCQKVSVAAANIGGTVVGAFIGTCIAPGIGTKIGGVLGGIIGSILMSRAAKNEMEKFAWFNDKKEREIQTQLIKEALDVFGFKWKDIKHPKKFNEQTIARKYRARAKEFHPDRPGCDADQFLKLNNQLGILMGLLTTKDHVKDQAAKNVKAITWGVGDL